MIQCLRNPAVPVVIVKATVFHAKKFLKVSHFYFVTSCLFRSRHTRVVPSIACSLFSVVFSVEAMNDTMLAAFFNGSDLWGGEC